MSMLSRSGFRSPRTGPSTAGGPGQYDEKSGTNTSPYGPYPTRRPRRLEFLVAINPSFIRLLRLVLYTITSAAAVVTAVFAILVVAYYEDHTPSIKPSWSSDIALIVFGLGTPAPLFATLLFTPRLVRRGGVMASFVGQVRSELFLLFALAAIWVSGALAMAVDLRGYANCIWDGYYHWPKPTDFRHVCDLINTTVILGYVTFGLVAAQWAIVTTLAAYIFFYLDQEVLTEPAHDMGGRAYRAHLLTLSMAQDDSRPMAGGRPVEPLSEKGTSTPGPMAGGRLAALDLGGPISGHAFASTSGPGPMAGGRPAPRQYEEPPRSPVRQGSTGSLDAHEFDEEGLAEFARRPSTEQPRQAAPRAPPPRQPDAHGYVDYSRNPFESGYVA